MSEPQTTVAEILVHLVRPGAEAQDFHLAEGSTVADLLRASGIATSPAIAIDGVPIEESVRLVEGAVVTIGPSAGDNGVDERWGPPITAFQDEKLWREYREILEANRRRSYTEEDLES